MFIPSANFVGILLIIGGALCYLSYRSLAQAPLRDTKVGNPQLAAAIQWVALAVGIVLLVSGIAMGLEVMQTFVDAPLPST